MKLKVWWLIILLWGSSPSLAQVVLNPRSLILNPSPSFYAHLSLDKSQGNLAVTYQVGEYFHMSISVSTASFVYVYNLRPTGEVIQLFPNRFDGDNNYLAAGELRILPTLNGGYLFQASNPSGIDRLILVATTYDIDTSALATYEANNPFARSFQGEGEFTKNLSQLLGSLPLETWSSDSLEFIVR